MNGARYYKPLVVWLLIGCFLVVAMVMVGGITRLTHSGLSIANWNLIMGSVPPLNDQQWHDTFELYKQTPEFQEVNSHFTLEDFKSIFWWEYIHRLLGRLIGIVFLVPFLFFLVKKKIDRPLFKKLIVIFLLGGFQGFLGWFMVKSGLIDRPSVSHYRLAAHLITALFLFVYIFWVALDLIYPERSKHSFVKSKLRKASIIFISILGLQIMYGAFVAGLKAGFIMNTFPKMGGQWIHSSIGRGFADMGLSALTEHIVVVQFIHRYLGIFLFLAATWIWIKYKKAEIEDYLKNALNLLFGAVILQVLLGIFTLINAVPVWLGVLHQLGAIVLLGVTVYLIHRIHSAPVGLD